MSLRSSPGLVTAPSRMRSGSGVQLRHATEDAPAIGGGEARTSASVLALFLCAWLLRDVEDGERRGHPFGACCASRLRTWSSSVDLPAPLGPTIPMCSVFPTKSSGSSRLDVPQGMLPDGMWSKVLCSGLAWRRGTGCRRSAWERTSRRPSSGVAAMRPSI